MTNRNYQEYLIESLKNRPRAALYIWAILQEENPEPELLLSALQLYLKPLREANLSEEENKIIPLDRSIGIEDWEYSLFCELSHPCSQCHYYSDNQYLPCTVNPTSAKEGNICDEFTDKTNPSDTPISLAREKLRSSAPQWRNKPLRSDDYMKPMLAKSTEPPELNEETLTALPSLKQLLSGD